MFNIVQLYKDYNVKYWTEGPNVSPGWVNVQCPFCSDDHNHLGFNLEKGYFNCWKCGVHDTKKTISKLIGTTVGFEDLIWEYSKTAPLLKQLNRKKARAKSVNLPGSALNKFHRKYLTQRRFDPDYLIEKYRILGTGPGERWEDLLYELRIIIPIIYNGEVVSFQARDITDKQKERYKGCLVEKSVVNYKHILYNMDNAKGSRVVVCEGITDVWRMGDGFVASFGSTLTPSQIRMLARFEEIVFLFDSEPEAQTNARKYARQLASLRKDVTVIDLCGEDPGDLSEVEAEKVRKELNCKEE